MLLNEIDVFFVQLTIHNAEARLTFARKQNRVTKLVMS